MTKSVGASGPKDRIGETSALMTRLAARQLSEPLPVHRPAAQVAGGCGVSSDGGGDGLSGVSSER